MRSVLVSDCKVAGAGWRSLWVRPSKCDEAFETCLDTASEAKGRGHWRQPPLCTAAAGARRALCRGRVRFISGQNLSLHCIAY